MNNLDELDAALKRVRRISNIASEHTGSIAQEISMQAAQAAESLERVRPTALELIENLHATELRANANGKMLKGASLIANELAGEVNRIKAQNAVLLSALKPFAAIDLAESGIQSTFAFNVLHARAAIASTEESNP